MISNGEKFDTLPSYAVTNDVIYPFDRTEFSEQIGHDAFCKLARTIANAFRLLLPPWS